jgi:uncharacterized membrane protein HdeD (DUF308 family)
MLHKKEQNAGAFISFWAISLLLVYLSFFIAGFKDEVSVLSAIGIILLCSGCLCLLVMRKYRKAQNPAMADYLNIGVQRYVLAILMTLYGIDKILGNFFDYQLFALDSKLADVSEFELTWFFYGKNHWQELFTGIMELVPGLFLLHRRTYYIAAMVLLPVTTQVFLLNLFFKIGGITFPAALILLACNLYIIYSQKEKIILFFKSLDYTLLKRPLTGKTKVLIQVLKGIGLFLVFMTLYVKIKPVFFTSPYQGRYKNLVGVYTLKEMKKNGIAYKPGSDSLYYKDLYIEKQDRWNMLRRFDGRTEAFILNINTGNDSLSLYLNKGGAGDDPDIIDSASALKGVYKLDLNYLTIKGVQQGDTVALVYEKQEHLKAKSWFW